MFGIVRFMIMTAGMCNVNKLECLFLKDSGLFITWLKKQDRLSVLFLLQKGGENIFYRSSTSRAGKVMISHFYQGITYRMQGYIGQI